MWVVDVYTWLGRFPPAKELKKLFSNKQYMLFCLFIGDWPKIMKPAMPDPG